MDLTISWVFSDLNISKSLYMTAQFLRSMPLSAEKRGLRILVTSSLIFFLVLRANMST